MKTRLLVPISLLTCIILSVLISMLTLSTQSIRLDEAQSLWVSSKSIPMILHLVAQDVHVPLYEFILHFWLQFFGLNITMARGLSFIFFLFTLPVLYRLCREASNRNIALMSVAFFSFSPFILWYSNEARMYSLFTLITSLNHLYFLRLYHSQGMKSRAGYFITTLLGMYTHYFFFILLFSQSLFVLLEYVLHFFRDKVPIRSLWTENKQFLLSYLQSLVLAGILFLPWFIYFILMGGAANTQPLIPPPTSYNLFQVFINFLFGFQSQLLQSILVSLWPLFILILFFIFTQRQRMLVSDIPYFTLVSFSPIAIVFLLSYIKPIFLSRYLIFVTPTLFFMIAWFILGYSKRVSAIIATISLVILFGLLLLQNLSYTTPVREDYQQASSYLEEEATPRDLIAVSAPFTIYPIEYSYQGHSRITTIPVWDRYNQGSIPPFNLSTLQQDLSSYQKTYQNIFLVLSYDQGYENTIKHYMDTHYQLKLTRTFSEGLEVREYVLRYD